MKFSLGVFSVLSGLAVLQAPLYAATREAPVRWHISVSNSNARAGDELELIITAQIAPHWMVYSSDFKADMGPNPTEISFTGDSFEVIGSPRAVGPKHGRDKTWGTDYTYFIGRAEFRQRIKLVEPKLTGVVAVKGQLCNERDGTCTLFNETLKL